MAPDEDKSASSFAARMAQGETPGPEPIKQDRPQHGDREHQAKAEDPGPVQPTLKKTLKDKDKTTMAPLVAPEPVQEKDLSATSNEFNNPDADKIPKESILALFPDEEAWRTLSTAARENSRFHRSSVVAQVLYLSCLKNCVLPELLERGNLLAQGILPFAAMPKDTIDNQHAWIAWAVSLDETISNVLKQINWLDLLEAEYVAADPLWQSFWCLHQEVERQHATNPPTLQEKTPCGILAELEKIYAMLAGHNRRRLFLQTKMIQGRDWIARLLEEVPPWIEWDEVVSEMLGADIGGRFVGDGLIDNQGSGFVEETEDDEEFEL
ncbi:hypothetical protein AYL99_04684 [Fonsecaea erecta]|uniref:Uncharacterized protein n=1 Tax=Fonsecaea erecta TaxID=1367422 RepID=A0A178ZRN5_9EURO|nr:hypothetical protein AYL99_04684 [Fonsecaea erecta]OAP62479.1 hypothetical protein AYL99_04684 [Fonsecaea erecta]